jgi:hypothetical protein
MNDFYVTVEVRLMVRKAKDEADARFKAACFAAGASVEFRGVELKGQSVICCTPEKK